MKLRDGFIHAWLIYAIPFLFSTSRGGPFDFLFTVWGWNVELYLTGLVVGMGISLIIMRHDKLENHVSEKGDKKNG